MTRPTFSTPGTTLGAAPETALDPYRRAVRRHPRIVAIVALVTVLVAGAWAATRSSDYTTSAQILVTPASDDPAIVGLPILTASVDPTRTLQTAATMLSSPRAAALAAEELGGGTTAQDVRDAILVQPQGNGDVVAVTASAGTGRDAARLANAYAKAALTARADALGQQLETKLASVEARAEALSGAPDSATAAALAGQASTLQSIGDGQDPNFSLLQNAAVPASPGGAGLALVLVLAAIVGLALGTAVAMGVEHLDRRVRDEDELAELSTLPVLGRIPVERGHVAGSATTPAGSVEALRALQIQLEARGRGSRTIIVGSASEGDGKTTTAIALARAMASSGRRVVLLDFDLRKSEVGERLGVHSDLLGMLRADGSLTDVLVPLEGTRNLRVLSAPPVDDAGALFQAYSRRLPDLVEQARALADFVIVDTPPLGRVADALRLTAHADHLLLVTRPGHTDRRELAIAQETLRQLGVVPTGMIIVGGARRAAGYYGSTSVAAYPPLVPTTDLQLARGGAVDQPRAARSAAL